MPDFPVVRIPRAIRYALFGRFWIHHALRVERIRLPRAKDPT